MYDKWYVKRVEKTKKYQLKIFARKILAHLAQPSKNKALIKDILAKWRWCLTRQAMAREMTSESSYFNFKQHNSLNSVSNSLSKKWWFNASLLSYFKGKERKGLLVNREWTALQVRYDDKIHLKMSWLNIGEKK